MTNQMQFTASDEAETRHAWLMSAILSKVTGPSTGYTKVEIMDYNHIELSSFYMNPDNERVMIKHLIEVKSEVINASQD